MPSHLRIRILQIPSHWFEWDEPKLIKEVYGDVPHPPDKDFELRISFWEEYERCFPQRLKMEMKRVYKGIVSEDTFGRIINNSQGRLLFIVTEPSYWKKRQKLAHHLLLNEVLKIAKTPVGTDLKTGLPDTKIMSIKLKAYQYIEERLHGATIQKHQIEQRTQNLNVNVDAASATPIPDNIEDIDKRLAELEQELLEPPRTHIPTIQSPLEAVHKESGKVMDADFVRLDKRRDNSHKE